MSFGNIRIVNDAVDLLRSFGSATRISTKLCVSAIVMVCEGTTTTVLPMIDDAIFIILLR